MSHVTHFIAAGCYVSLGNRAKAQELFDALPELLRRKKVGGKDLPTEVWIRKKLEFSKEKQKRHGGDPAKFVECIIISPADVAYSFGTSTTIVTCLVSQQSSQYASIFMVLQLRTILTTSGVVWNTHQCGGTHRCIDRIECVPFPARALIPTLIAKIRRMLNGPHDAIVVLQRGLDAPQTSVHAGPLARVLVVSE
ncbi:hypothetical protein B0H14DRAFT_3137428 [Mycena olivaceomarginata]|nr:hypothetical protein B0H14DRAFT_3137428 [Mycena olivaceomarginata]